MAEKIKDSRFQKLNYDPKFQNMSKKQDKVKIDSRFKEMFTSDKYKVVGKTDKYGREIKAEKGQNKELDEYYYMSDDEEQETNQQKKKQEKKKLNKNINQSQKKQSKQQEESQESQEEDDDDSEIVIDENMEDCDESEEDQQQQNKKKGQNKQNQKKTNNKKIDKRFQSKQQEDEEESDEVSNPFENGFEWNEVSSSDEGIEDMEDEIDEDLWEEDKKNVQYAKDTSKILALQNYDWVHISSKELMILFTSFCQNIGHIKSVTVYPSKFGKEMMEKENREGPQGIWKKDDEIDKEKIAKRKNKPMRTLDNRIIVKQDDKYSDLNIEALRKYEKTRLQYYYAIIECDTVKTAVNIYDNCNEQEFELTGIPLDLRFVPEDLQFPFEPKERCTKLPPITEVKNFTNRSLAHTNVQLTWDEPNFDKFKFLHGKDLNEEDLDKINWDEFLGDFDSDEDRDNDVQNDDEDDAQYQEELKKKNEQMDWRKNFDKKSKSKNRKEDMEIVFMSGFGDIQKNKEKREQEEKQLQEESGWERYLRLKKEKSKAKKLAKKQQKQTDEDYFIDPSNTLYKEQKENSDSDESEQVLEYDSEDQEDNQNKNKNNKKQQIKNKENKKSNLQSHEYLSLEERIKQKKAEKDRKRKEKQNLGLLVDDAENDRINDFKVDVEDERFKKMYEQTDFYLDPTSKNYKSKYNKAFLDEQQKQRKKKKIAQKDY